MDEFVHFLKVNDFLVNQLLSFLTAVGTIGAVWVSLWLSYRSNNPKLNIDLTVRPLGGVAKINQRKGVYGESFELIYINKSNITATIIKVYPSIFFMSYYKRGTLRLEGNTLVQDGYYLLDETMKNLHPPLNAHTCIHMQISRQNLVHSLRNIICTSVSVPPITSF